MATKGVNRTVLRVDRSPMNEKRWSLTLSCGHEGWVTSGRRPAKKTAFCAVCVEPTHDS